MAEVLRQIFGSAYERWRDDWARRLYELVLELEARDVDIDAIANRPAFVTAVHDASRIAVGEHIDMVKAVLFNAATHNPNDVADLWTQRYLRWVDEFSREHIAVHRRLRNPDDPNARDVVGEITADILALVAFDLNAAKLIVGTVTRNYRTTIPPKPNPGRCHPQPVDPGDRRGGR